MKKLISAFFIIIGLALGFLVIPAILEIFDADDSTSQANSGEEYVLSEVKSIAELSVLEYDYSNASSGTDTIQFAKILKDLKIPFTTKTVVMQYDGIIKLGADTSQIKVGKITKSLAGNITKISITLPPIQVLSHEIDRDSIEFPVEKDTILNKLKTEDFAKLEETAREEMEQRALESDIIKTAANDLQTKITSYLQAIYGENIDIQFTQTKSDKTN